MADFEVINDTSFTKYLLKSFGISNSSINKFEVEEIDHSLFKYLNDRDLERLLPTIKERALYRKGLEEYLKTKEEISTSTVTPTNTPNEMVCVTILSLQSLRIYLFIF